MNIEKQKKWKNVGADQFFVSHFTASASVAILWLGYVWQLPDFLSGIAAGLFLVAFAGMWIWRGRDEYTSAIWHSGTAAGFATIVLWLVAHALFFPFDSFAWTNNGTAALLSVTVYLVTVFVKLVGGRN